MPDYIIYGAGDVITGFTPVDAPPQEPTPDPDTSVTPVAPSERAVIELPYARSGNSTEIMVMALKANADQQNGSVWINGEEQSTPLVYQPIRLSLAVDLNAADRTIRVAGGDLPVDQPLLVGQEIIRWTSGGVLERGLFDTLPSNVSRGAIIWDLRHGWVSERGQAASNTGVISGITVTSNTSSDDGIYDTTLPTMNIALSDRQTRPLRPANILINGDYSPTAIDGDLQITYSARNRLNPSIIGWYNDAAQSPDTGVNIIVSVSSDTITQFGITTVKTLTETAGDIITVTSQELFNNLGSTHADLTVSVFTRKNQLDSWVRHIRTFSWEHTAGIELRFRAATAANFFRLTNLVFTALPKPVPPEPRIDHRLRFRDNDEATTPPRPIFDLIFADQTPAAIVEDTATPVVPEPMPTDFGCGMDDEGNAITSGHLPAKDLTNGLTGNYEDFAVNDDGSILVFRNSSSTMRLLNTATNTYSDINITGLSVSGNAIFRIGEDYWGLGGARWFRHFQIDGTRDASKDWQAPNANANTNSAYFNAVTNRMYTVDGRDNRTYIYSYNPDTETFSAAGQLTYDRNALGVKSTITGVDDHNVLLLSSSSSPYRAIAVSQTDGARVTAFDYDLTANSSAYGLGIASNVLYCIESGGTVRAYCIYNLLNPQTDLGCGLYGGTAITSGHLPTKDINSVSPASDLISGVANSDGTKIIFSAFNTSNLEDQAIYSVTLSNGTITKIRDTDGVEAPGGMIRIGDSYWYSVWTTTTMVYFNEAGGVNAGNNMTLATDNTHSLSAWYRPSTQRVYMADFVDGIIYVYSHSGTTLTALTAENIDTGWTTSLLGVSGIDDNGKLLTTRINTEGVFGWDIATGTRDTGYDFDTATGNDYAGGIIPVGNLAYLTDRTDNKFYTYCIYNLLNPQTDLGCGLSGGTTIRSGRLASRDVTSPVDNVVHPGAFSDDGATAYSVGDGATADPSGRYIRVLDIASNSIVGNYHFASTNERPDILFRVGQTLYTYVGVKNFAHTFWAIDTNGQRQSSLDWQPTGIHQPSGTFFDAISNRVYILHGANSTISVWAHNNGLFVRQTSETISLPWQPAVTNPVVGNDIMLIKRTSQSLDFRKLIRNSQNIFSTVGATTIVFPTSVGTDNVFGMMGNGSFGYLTVGNQWLGYCFHDLLNP